MRSFAAGAVGLASVTSVFIACVGDDATPANSPSDSGGTDADTGATTDSAVSSDTSSETDARPTVCDPAKEFAAPVVVTELGGGLREGYAVLTQDLKTVYFSSYRDGGLGFFDLYVASRPTTTAPFTAITSLPVVNTPSEDYFAAVSDDQRLMIFTSDRTGYKLWKTARTSTNANFDPPEPFDIVNDAGGSDPSLRADGAELYFTRNNGTDHDIWRTVASGGVFASPTPVTELNTTAEETNAVVTSDDLVIYWSSTRPGGAGKADIWVATRSDPGVQFGNPRVVAELSSATTDRATFISADRCTIYLTRNDKIYVAMKTP